MLPSRIPFPTRRTVVRQLILGTAVSLVGGALPRLQSLLAAESTGTGSEGALTLKISQFPALSSLGGSVRLNVGLDAPIVLSRGPGDAFYAVSARCQHLGCIVNTFNPDLGLILCSCHGSTYHIDGSLAGGPAERGLVAYAAVFDGIDRVTVRLPDLGFGARQIAIEGVSGETRHFSLSFRPQLFATYQVLFRSELAGAAEPIPFATTPDGAATETSYVNRNTNDPTPVVLLYVEMNTPRGFFQIAQVVTEY